MKLSKKTTLKNSDILYTSGAVKKAIVGLLKTSKARRVVITAFVGNGAEAYLPKPNGLHLICWPKVGGTNPSAIRKLIKNKVKVSFVDSLHMKVYWTEDVGSIITSANLSTNALGSGNLKEVGVFLAPGKVDIDKLINSLKTRSVTKRELAELQRQHDLHVKRNKIKLKSEGLTFKEWYETPLRTAWKFGWADYEGDLSSNAQQIVKNEYNVRDCHNFVAARKKDFVEGDRVLFFLLKKNTVSQIKWGTIDFVVRISKSDKEYAVEYPYQAVQVWPNKIYETPPFQIDKAFRQAFLKTIKEFGVEKIQKLKSLTPTKKFTDLLLKNYLTQ